MPEILQWWNLVYVLAFFLALLYTFLNALGLATSSTDVDSDVGGFDHDVDVDHDISVDHDVGDIGVDHDIDMDHDVGDFGVDHDVDVDHDVSVGHDVDGGEMDHHVPDFHVDASGTHVPAVHGGQSTLEVALSFFGIGKVPLSVILMTFLLTFSVIGWGVNTVLSPVLRTPVAFFPISFAAALFTAAMGTKLLASVLGRYLKPIESSAVPRSALVGRIGTACLPITSAFGSAHVRDDFGSLHKVTCKVPEGAETIPNGQTVLLVRFVRVQDPGRRAGGFYLVEPYEVPNHS